MGTILQIAGLSGLILIAALVVGYFYLRHKIRSFIGFAKELSESAVPPRVSLVPAEESDFDDQEEFEMHRDALARHGFTAAGCFEIEEMSGVIVFGMVHPSERFAAAICEHPAVGVWFDLVTESADRQQSMTATTCEQGAELDSPPWKLTIRRPDASVDDLMQILRDEAPSERRELPAASFAEFFQDAYAREMDWRNERGGATEEEITRVAEASGQGYTQEAISVVGEVLGAQAEVAREKVSNPN